MKTKLKDRATCIFICLAIMFIPLRVLAHYQIIQDSVQNKIIAAGIGLVIYLMMR